MDAVIINDEAAIKVELRAVVGGEAEAIAAWLLDPETAGVIDGEPFVAAGDAGEALLEVTRRDVEACCVDGADGPEMFEVRKPYGIDGNEIDIAAQA